MKPSWLRTGANALLVASALYAVVWLADEALRVAFGSPWLLAPRLAFGRALALVMLAVLPALVLTPRLPLGVFAPLALGTLWLATGAAPLPLWLSSGRVGPLCAALHFDLVGLALVCVRVHNGSRGWLFHAGSPEAPAFAWRRALGLGAAALLLGPPLTLAYFGLSIATSLQQHSQGFLHFDRAGVSLGDRHYVRDGRDVRLVGMVHVGEEQAYRELVASFSRRDTLVLTEGVSDRDSLLRGQLSYGNAAQALGLQPQQDLRVYLVEPERWDDPLPEWPHLREADLDASAFAPETLEWIAWAGELWASQDLASALRALVVRMVLQDPEQWAIVQADILDARNEHLIAELATALEQYPRVIVPWGALHLPAVERALLEWGFEPTRRERRRLASWTTIAEALF